MRSARALLFDLWVLSLGALCCQAQVTIVEYAIPSGNGDGITLGPDGNLWFTEHTGNKIGRITPAGVITEFPVPTANSGLDGIAAGPDGNLWFAEFDGNAIGRITTAGIVAEFPVPTPNSQPAEIAPGPDGNLWFSEYGGNKIGRITPAGVITEFLVPTPGSIPYGIVAGPDGNLWFTERSGNKIGRITTAGTITEFLVPTVSSLAGITLGPDGNLWFAEDSANQIGRITPAGVIVEFPVPTAGGSPYGITAGPDGNLWFTEFNGNKVGRISTVGVAADFPVPTAGTGPIWIVAGPDGNIWFTEFNGNKVGRVILDPPDAFQIYYSANLALGDSVVNLTNSGANSTSAFAVQNGNLCVNAYVYSPDEQLVSCCSCVVTPNGLVSLSVTTDLLSNPLTPIRPSSVVIKLLASSIVGTASCDAASVTRAGASNQLTGGMVAWGSTLHLLPATAGSPAGTPGMTETLFSKASLSDAELNRMTQLCGFIRANGSGYGICKSCRVGGLGSRTK